MRVIGLTGSIACGKSTVSRELLRRGFPVIDGDGLSRELTAEGGAALPDLRDAFGSGFFRPDGTLDRAALGRLVFSDPASLERLNRVMAPHLLSLTRSRLEENRAAGAKLCFLDMALLLEQHYDRLCDTVWCVWLPEELQLDRLMQRDGYTREEALQRMRSVLSSDEKARLSSAVIDNSGPVEETLRQVQTLVEKELARAETAPRRRRAAAPREPVPEEAAQQALLSPTVPDLTEGRTRGVRSAPAEEPAGMERPEAARKKRSTRKSAWPMPKALTISLIALAAVLALAFTGQILMNAWLTSRAKAHEAEQRSIDSHYPLYYREEITRIAEEYNLAPALVAAVILNESSFQPTAESGVGARGLMQLMPDTAEWIAHKLRYEDYSFAMMDEPEHNIRFGCWYLNYLGSLFGGDPLCVVCAYHAGQGEVSSWLSNPNVSTDGHTTSLDRLPEGPTKIYAGRVTRDYGIYQAKYFSPAPPSQEDGAADLSASADPS